MGNKKYKKHEVELDLIKFFGGIFLLWLGWNLIPI